MLLASRRRSRCYIAYAFRNVPNSLRYGVSAIVALLHDVVLVVGIFSILGKVFDTEVNTFFITGMLTVVGFSVHDSIVVFDRIRENVARGRIRSFPDAVNHSLLQTMGRSFNTSLTLIFSILALLLLGGDSIRDFLLVLLIGVTTGTYSSVFIASMFLVTWQQGDIPRAWRRLTRPAGAPRHVEAARRSSRRTPRSRLGGGSHLRGSYAASATALSYELDVNCDSCHMIGFVYDPMFLDHDTGAHPENGNRMRRRWRCSKSAGCSRSSTRIAARDATPDELALVHDPRVRRGGAAGGARRAAAGSIPIR